MDINMKIAVFYDNIEEAARQNNIKPVKNIFKIYFQEEKRI